MRKTTKPWARMALAAAVLSALPGAVPAQPFQQPLQQLAIPIGELAPDAKESLQNVTVNDSPEARKDIETARQMERQKEWNKAAGWYQEVLEKYRTRVVAWKADDRNVINLYRGIVYQVQEALAKWPEDGIRAYRGRYETAAATMLENAGPDDYNTLNGVLETYFITESAKLAGLKLIDLHMEAGEFDAAARIGEYLLDWYPPSHLVVERPRLLYRTALAHHLCGDDKTAEQRANELKRKFADTMGTIFGKDVALSESLDELMKQKPAAVVAAMSPDSWPMFGGSADRSHVSAAQGRMGAKVASIDLPKRVFRGPNAALERNAAQQDEDSGRTLGIMPVVDGGALFFQDGTHIFAVNLDSGIPLPGWMQTYNGGDRKGTYTLRTGGGSRTQQLTLTVTESAVLAIMGQSNQMQQLAQMNGEIQNVSPDNGTRLVCLDRDTGKERWKIAMPALVDERIKDDERERLRALDMTGSPLVSGDNVFVIARGGKDPQFENCYVLCFDLTTGKYRWSCLVASASSSFNVYGGIDPSQGGVNTVSHLALAGGRLYVLTNLGALAAVDAYNGSVVWLSLYPRDMTSNGYEGNVNINFGVRSRQGASAVLRAWEYNPVFARDGKLFILPTDGKYLLVYDASTGAEIKRINMEDFDHANTMLAVTGDQVIMTGRRQVYGIDWARYDTSKAWESNRSLGHVWQGVLTPPDTSIGASRTRLAADTVRGRGFVTADSVFVTTDWSIYRLSVKDGRILERYPKDRPEWDDKEGPGNVLVTGEHVVVAGSKSVNVYTDMTVARAKLDRNVAAAPGEAEPRLDYAEVMFAAGQTAVSLEMMTEATELLGGEAGMRPGAARQRLFSRGLAFAEKLAKDKRPESNETALRFYGMAAQAADSASEQVNYRLSRAKFARDNIDADSYDTAVRLYQEILSQPELRRVGITADPDGNGTQGVAQAAVVAEKSIAEIIVKRPAAYRAIEEQAAAAMEAAKADEDAPALLEVAQTYPNATVAPKSMMLAADTYEASGNARLATYVLRQIYRKYNKNGSEKAALVEAMARNYLTLPGGIDIAISRLQRAKLFGDLKLTRPMVLPDGSKIEGVTLKDALAILELAKPGESAAGLPDLHVPQFQRLTDEERAAGKTPPEAFIPAKDDKDLIAIDNVTAVALQERPDGGRNDRFVARTNAGLTLFAAGQAKPLGSNAVLGDASQTVVWLGKDQRSNLAVWTGNEIAVLNGDTAATLWKSPLKSLSSSELVATAAAPGVDAATDSASPNDNVDDATVIRRARGGLIIRGGGRVIIRGNMLPGPVGVDEQPLAPIGEEQIASANALGDRIIAATTTGRLICFDTATGTVQWQSRVSSRGIDQLVANEDFTVVRVTESNLVRIIVLDNYDGRIQMVRNFSPQTGIVPLNMALSPDGMLVWTLIDRLCGKDLYEPGNALKFEYPANRPDPNTGVTNPIYTGCTKPGQLLIRGQQIIALELNGRFVCVHSLEDGTLLSHNDHGKKTVTQLSTKMPAAQQAQGNAEAPVTLRLAGPYLYALSPRSLVAYNLARPADDNWTATAAPQVNPNFRSAAPGRDFLVVVSELPPKLPRMNGVPSGAYKLQLFSRAQTNTNPPVERGHNDYTVDLTDPTGIVQWQIVDGGIYYLTGEHKLHFLRGSRPAT